MVKHFAFKLTNLGGTNVNTQPPHGLLGGGANSTSGSGMEGGNDRGMNRTVLRNAFGKEIVNTLYDYENNKLITYTHESDLNYNELNPILDKWSITSDWDVSGTFTDLSDNIKDTLDTSYNINPSTNVTSTNITELINNCDSNTDCSNITFTVTFEGNGTSALNLTKSILTDIPSNSSDNSFNNLYINSLTISEKTSTTVTHFVSNVSGLTPFRRVMNAGDINLTDNKSTSNFLKKPPNQVDIGTTSLTGWKGLAGSVKTESGGAAYSGNPRYVYSGGDYTRFKKLQAVNRNYNDKSFGGDQHNASQQAYRRTHG